MSSFRSKSYGSGEKNKIVCLVTGYKGKISGHQRAAHALLMAGYDVVVYEYDRDVFDAGDAKILLTIVEEINADFKVKAKKYKEAACAGVSLGALIAFNVQRHMPKAKLGLYGTAGIPVSHAIFTSKPFRGLKKAFVANGYTEKSLRKAWTELEILDDPGVKKDQAFVIVMGKMDRIVPYKKSSKIMDTWKANGTNVHYFAKRGKGHIATIAWYKKNLGTMLEHAKML
jgi:esterase/lipase